MVDGPFYYKTFDCPLDGSPYPREMLQDERIARQIKYYRDGRQCSPIVEEYLVFTSYGEFIKPPKEKKGFDLIKRLTGEGEEVKALTRQVCFSASFMQGGNRKFDPERFRAGLKFLDSYFIADAYSFPLIRVWRIPATTVRQWFDWGKLGKRASCYRRPFFELIREPLPPRKKKSDIQTPETVA